MARARKSSRSLTVPCRCPKTTSCNLHFQNKSHLAFARNAMATRFEIVLPGDDSTRLRAAAEEAFDEIDRLEAQLSLFRATSEIANINARAASESVRVSSETFRLLEHAARLSSETDGTFD